VFSDLKALVTIRIIVRDRLAMVTLENDQGVVVRAYILEMRNEPGKLREGAINLVFETIPILVGRIPVWVITSVLACSVEIDRIVGVREVEKVRSCSARNLRPLGCWQRPTQAPYD
jgi:hypothetical protein